MEIQKQERVASAPVSVRMTPEVNEKFKALSGEFGFANQNQAMENLIAAFELQQARNLIPTRAKEIEEFADHVKRLNDIYLNALELNVNTEDFIRMEYSQRIETQQDVIQSQQEQITISKSTISDLTTQLKESQKTITESEKTIKAVEAQASTQAQLIAEYREKNETLASMITKNQATLDQAEQIKLEYQSLQSEFASYKINAKNEANEQIKMHENEISDMNKKIDQAAIVAERMNEKHQVAIERAKEQSDLALEKLTNKLQAQYQEKLQAIHDQHNKQVAELLNLQSKQLESKSPIDQTATPMQSVIKK